MVNSNINHVKRLFGALLRETYNFFFCKRMGAFFLVWFFFLYIYMKPIRKFSMLVNYPATPWGILFAFSSVYFNLVFIVGAIYLYSKVPFMESAQMYQFIRLGRRKWIFVQMFKIFITSFLYTAAVFGFSVLIMLPQLEWKTEWGKLYYTMALTNSQEKAQLMFDVSYHLINEYEPLTLMVLSFLLFSLIVSFVGLLMFLVSLRFSRTFSVIVATFFAVAQIALENAGRSSQRIMVNIIPTEWLKIAKAGEKNIMGVLSPDFEDIMGRLIIMILMIAALICLSGSRALYDWYGED